MRCFVNALGMIAFCLLGSARADFITYNSPNTDQNGAARNGWLRAIGIEDPQHRIDFESGFVDGQNLSNQVGLFPGRLSIRDTSTRDRAIVESGPGSVSLSNPVGNFALTWEGNLFEYLELDFSGAPVDYVGWQDIDTTSNNSLISIYFEDGTYTNFRPDDTYTTGDSAEFLGFFRNNLPQIKKVRLNLSGDLYGIDNIEYGHLPEVASLSGDFNDDGSVDAADYTAWRKTATTGAAGLAAATDYDTWRADFGETLDFSKQTGGIFLAASFSGSAVPEPSPYLLVLASLAVVLMSYRHRLA